LTSRNTDLVLAALQPGRQSSSRYNDGVRRSLDELGPWTKAADGPREALLHDVAKNDSLAGIALQYGITVRSPLLASSS
jgi:LysM repeat protein